MDQILMPLADDRPQKYSLPDEKADRRTMTGAISRFGRLVEPLARLGVLPVVLAGLLSVSAPALAQISLVRVTTCGPGAFPANVCTIPATQNGNLIVVAWASAWTTVPTVGSVTDNVGNVYSQVPNARSVYSTLMMNDIWYAKNSKAGATTVTITPNPSGNAGAAVIWEFSGVDTVSPLDQAAVLNNQPTTTTPLGAAVTTTAAREVIISTMGPVGSINGLLAGSPFTNLIFYGSGWAHLITSATGTYAAQWSIAGGQYHSNTVSFKAASSANACDLVPDGTVNILDVQKVVNMLPGGTEPCTANITGPGVCNSTTVQRVVNAALGQACVVDAPPPDTTPPTVSMTAPTAGSTLSGTATVTASASDNVAMAGVQFLLDGATLGSEVTGSGPTYTLNWNTTSASNGPHTLSARARDAANNTATSTGVTITVSNGVVTPHTVTLSWVASTSPNVTYNVYRSSTSGGPYTKLNSSPISGLTYVDSAVVAGQTYYYVARAVDSGATESVNSNQTTAVVPSP